MLHRLFTVCAALAIAGCTMLPRQEAPPAAAPTLWSASAADALTALASDAPAEGLPAYEDALATLRTLQIKSGASAADAAAFDAAADALFADLARTYAQGALDPQRVDPAWRIPRPAAPDTSSWLITARADAAAVRALQTLLPDSPDYAALRAELARVSAEAPGALDAAGRTREARIARLRASQERWRWLPRHLPAPRIEVHTAQYQVTLHQVDGAPLTHNAIVGARTTQTPSFAADIVAVTLNPSWTPPRSILLNELLPDFARDPGAAARGGYEITNSAGIAIDPALVDWRARPFPYQVRQRPGAANALGRVKFEMPNPYDIYLHDTPNHALFARERRALSHGCVRVDDALDLAAAILATPAAALQQNVDAGATVTLPLNAPLPIYVVYMTVTGSGDAITYADDIYGRDAAIIAALDAAPAAVAQFAPSSSECAFAQ